MFWHLRANSESSLQLFFNSGQNILVFFGRESFSTCQHSLQQCCYNLEYTDWNSSTGNQNSQSDWKNVIPLLVWLWLLSHHMEHAEIYRNLNATSPLSPSLLEPLMLEHVQINLMAISKPLLSIAAEKDCIANWNIQKWIAISVLPHVASI